MQSLIRSKSAGVTGGRGTAGAGPGRDLLYWHMNTNKAKLGKEVNIHIHSHKPLIPWTQDLPLTHQHIALNQVK